jgi:hypothetical protein
MRLRFKNLNFTSLWVFFFIKQKGVCPACKNLLDFYNLENLRIFFYGSYRIKKKVSSNVSSLWLQHVVCG